MNEKVKEKQKKHVLNVIFNLVGYLLIAVIGCLIILLSSMRADNQIYMFFGYSLAVIQSDSMAEGGFYAGDKVVVQEINLDDLRVGDIIIFYKFVDACDMDLPKYEISDIMDEYEKPETDETAEIFNQRTPLSEIFNVDGQNVILIFHRITGILVDDYGTKFFKTKGDSAGEGFDDPFLTREDYVVGKHCETTKLLNFFLKLTSTPLGMVLLISIPVSILIILQINTLLTVLSIASIVHKLRNKKFEFDEKNLLKYDISEYLSEEEKLFIFDITENTQKQKVASLMWNDILDMGNVSNKNIETEKILHSFELYSKNRNKFWDFWLKNEKNLKKKKRLDFFRLQADLMLNYDLGYKTAKFKAREINKGGYAKNV